MTLGALRLRLIDDWHAVLTKAWSVRLMLVAVGLEALNQGLQLYGTIAVVTHPAVLSTAAMFCAASAPVARIVAQKSMQKASPVQCSDWDESDG